MPTKMAAPDGWQDLHMGMGSIAQVGLLLGTEASVMTPNSVDFSFFPLLRLSG